MCEITLALISVDNRNMQPSSKVFSFPISFQDTVKIQLLKDASAWVKVKMRPYVNRKDFI